MLRTISFYLLTIFFISAVLPGCSADDDDFNTAACDVDNPLVDLPWLRAYIESASGQNSHRYSDVTQGTYRGQTVFILGICCPGCMTILPPGIQACDGSFIPGAYVTDVENIKVIWRSQDGC